MTASIYLKRYQAFLGRLPAPGGGGAHQALYGAGCFGVRAGVSSEQVCADIRQHLPEGSRAVSDDEIAQAVDQAFRDSGKNGGERREPPPPAVDPNLLHRLIAKGRGTTEEDIMARSPMDVRGWTGNEMACRVLDALYAPDEFLYIGDDGWRGELGKTIRTKSAWMQVLCNSGPPPWPKLMLNPLSGKPSPKKSGDGVTYRGDACIADHRYVVVEHDTLPLADQLAFWATVPALPVVALIFSGKKSLHAWVRVDCKSDEEWRREVEGKLFPSYLTPLKVDPTTKNASRLTRLPGHRRADTGLIQKVLYLAPEGKAVSK